MITVGIPKMDREGATGYYLEKLLPELERIDGVQTVVISGRVTGNDVDILHFNFSPIHPDPRRVNSVTALLSNCPKVATIHGNEIFVEPELFDYASRAELMYRRLMIPLTARFLDGVIADSEDSATHLSKHLHCPPERVHAVPLGVDHDEFYEVADANETVEQKYEIKPGYILHLSNYSRRKNPDVLLKAFEQSKKSHNRDLVVAGGGWVDEIEPTDRVHVLGRVPQEDLAALYGAASVFFNPTLEEAFGLPNLEAMACGTTVLSSNVYSIPEVVGDCGVLCNPEDAGVFAEEIVRLIKSPELRTELTEKGLERASEFTWRRTAEKTVEVYQSILANE